MKIKGLISRTSLRVESVDFSQISQIISPLIQEISFSSLGSVNRTLQKEIQDLMKLSPQENNEKLVFKGIVLKRFLTLDRVYSAAGQIILDQGEVVDFSFEQGIFSFQGESVSRLTSLIFPDLPFTEGNFILKKGWLSTRIFLENGPEETFFIKTRHKVRKTSLRSGYIREFFVSLLPFIPALCLLFMLQKKPLILAPSLALYLILLISSKKTKKARYFQKPLCRN